MSERWFRDVYRDAVWESETLTAAEKAVAETYARHARDERDEKSASANLSWLTYPRIMAKAGIGRRANVSAAVAGLVAAGWLIVIRESSRRPTLYRLAIPAGSSDGGTNSTNGARSSGTGTTVVPPTPRRSSAPASGSSDGGTQPLRPLEDPPSLSRPHAPGGPLAGAEDRERAEDFSKIEPQDLPHRFVVQHGATADEAPRVVADIQAEHRPRGNGWWRKVDQEGDLGDIVAQALTRVRAPATEPAAAEQPVDVAGLIFAARRDGPHCDEHAVPGGRFLHPLHGSPLCPYCRRGLPPTTTRQETTSS